MDGLDALSNLGLRIKGDSTDRPSWLAARAHGITATEVRELRLGGGEAYEHELIVQKKAGGDQRDLSGVRYIRHGQLREPVIAEWIRERFGIEPNALLFHSYRNERHLATPDGIGVNFDEEIIISEIKTSKHDLDPALPRGHFHSTGYYYQMQWQMYVTGAHRCLFVWEQHDDDWSGWPESHPAAIGEPRWVWVEYDPAEVERLLGLANHALDALDGATVPRKDDLELSLLTREYLNDLALEKRAAAAKIATWKRLQLYMNDRPGDVYPATGARVFWAPETAGEITVPDFVAAHEADPGLFERMEAARSEWEAHLANFTTTEMHVTKASLRVTAEKEKK